MIRSVGLLIDDDASLEDVAHKVAAAASGTTAATADPRAWQVRLGAVDATLSANHPGVAGESLARRYRFALAARLPDGSTTAGGEEVRTLREACRCIRDVTDMPALLVLDGHNHRPSPTPADEAPPLEPPDAGDLGA